MKALRWRGMPLILMYHAVAREAHDPNQLCVSPERFAAQMTWLARHGLRGVSVASLLRAVQRGGAGGLVGITFDDGYRSVLRGALPVLRRHGFGATAFVLSDPPAPESTWDEGTAWPLLAADEIRELAAGGVEIGSHGATHTRLTGLPPSRLAAEVADSRAVLGEIAGGEVQGFAYPWGAMDAAARAAVAAAGYAYACAVSTPYRGLSPLALPRAYVGDGDGGLELALKRRLHKVNSIWKGRFA